MGDREVLNTFSILRATQSLVVIVFPPAGETLNNTVDDTLHNDILSWLERKGVGWTRAEVHTNGKDFVNSITTALFPLNKNDVCRYE